MTDPLANDRFAAANGIELIDSGPGYARTRMTVSERHLNAVGVVHGGALFTLAASAFFAAANAPGNLALGISLNLSCLKAASSGTLLAEAKEVSRTRRLSTCTVRVTDEHGQLLALFQGTAYVKTRAAGKGRGTRGEG